MAGELCDPYPVHLHVLIGPQRLLDQGFHASWKVLDVFS